MSYTKQNFKDGNVLTAEELNAMDEQIYENQPISQCIKNSEKSLTSGAGYNLQTQIDALNTKIGTGLCNANKNGITEYPTQAGCYRVVNGGIAGLPSGNASYGTLLLVDGGTYVMNFYIDAQNTFYWCRTSGFETPKLWATVNPTMVNGVSAYS